MFVSIASYQVKLPSLPLSKASGLRRSAVAAHQLLTPVVGSSSCRGAAAKQ